MISLYNAAISRPLFYPDEDEFDAEIDFMDFVAPKFKPGEINRAGDAVVHRHEKLEFFSFLVDPQYEAARKIVENWRASHSYPLALIRNNLNNRARKVSSKAIVAKRLKRFESIVSKLTREPNMKLSQMQDLGGCRAIMPVIADVHELVRIHEEACRKSPDRHEIHRCKDYILNPRPSGYRGIHLIYKFRTENIERAAHDSQRIEVQIRSRLQHVWATAVEVVGAFREQALKSGQGSEEWRRLFALMGSVIARKEKSTLVPDTPDGDELIKEVRELSEEIKAEQFLAGCSSAAVHIGTSMKRAVMYLIVLDINERRVRILPQDSMLMATRIMRKWRKRIVTNRISRLCSYLLIR